MLPGKKAAPPACAQGQEKMSKSDPNSAIFMEDTEAEVGAALYSLLLRVAPITGPKPPSNVYIDQHRLGRWRSAAFLDHVHKPAGPGDSRSRRRSVHCQLLFLLYCTT